MLKTSPGPWSRAAAIYGPILAISTVLPILVLAPFLLLFLSVAGGEFRWSEVLGGGTSVLSGYLGFALSVLGGILGSIQGVLRVHTIWFKKTMPIALLANSRTLAIHHYRGRVRYIKFRECVGLREGPPAVVLESGEQVPIRCDGMTFRRVEREFLDPLYAWWWPHVSRTQVQARMAINQIKLSKSQLLMTTFLFPLFMFAFLLAMFNGRWWVLVAGAILFLPISFWMANSIRQTVQEHRETTFPIYDEEAEAEWTQDPYPEPADN